MVAEGRGSLFLGFANVLRHHTSVVSHTHMPCWYHFSPVLEQGRVVTAPVPGSTIDGDMGWPNLPKVVNDTCGHLPGCVVASKYSVTVLPPLLPQSLVCYTRSIQQ